MAPTPYVPDVLLTGPFHHDFGAAAGLTPDQLRSKCWRRLFRNVSVHASLPLTDQRRFDAVRLASPAHAIVTGVTAAWLYGVWTPPTGTTIPLHLAGSREKYGMVLAGARTSRLALDPEDIDEWHGIPISTPERTCFGLMAASTFVEAVVWADGFLHARLVTSQGLMRYADERPYWPHVRKVREAVALARPGAASPMESRLRMVIVQGGLPEPDYLNEPYYAADGTLLGIPDMRFRRPNFGIEYDGEQHAEAEHHIADLRRENGMLLGDLPLLRYTARDVFRTPQLIVREVGTMLSRAA
ncbi:MAG TPA: hypothetical protein VGJ14_18005 [Sporichthyaceae bacterium]|jgi:hypothetical protein